MRVKGARRCGATVALERGGEREGEGKLECGSRARGRGSSQRERERGGARERGERGGERGGEERSPSTPPPPEPKSNVSGEEGGEFSPRFDPNAQRTRRANTTDTSVVVPVEGARSLTCTVRPKSPELRKDVPRSRGRRGPCPMTANVVRIAPLG